MPGALNAAVKVVGKEVVKRGRKKATEVATAVVTDAVTKTSTRARKAVEKQVENIVVATNGQRFIVQNGRAVPVVDDMAGEGVDTLNALLNSKQLAVGGKMVGGLATAAALRAHPALFIGSTLLPFLPAIGAGGLGFIVGSGPGRDFLETSFKSTRKPDNPIDDVRYGLTDAIVPRIALIAGVGTALTLGIVGKSYAARAALAGQTTMAAPIAGLAGTSAAAAGVGMFVGEVDLLDLANPLKLVPDIDVTFWDDSEKRRDPRGGFDEGSK